ncbi:hypothetical protein CJF31_00003986 [Rutstroemia sp. NJR-2017a BVV2]|nr:hypothetical protein CJF31_00003986 [Rutstroemia sp. NJR-2017a BVV2]
MNFQSNRTASARKPYASPNFDAQSNSPRVIITLLILNTSAHQTFTMPRRNPTAPRRRARPSPSRSPSPPADLDLPPTLQHPSAPGLSIQILSPITHLPFPTHPSPDPSPTPNILTTYIQIPPSPDTSTPFSIHFRIGRPFPKQLSYSKLQFSIFIDGIWVWDAWCARPRYRANGYKWEEEVRGVKTGKGKGCTESGFKFVGIETNTDTPSYTTIQRISESLSKVGTIEIKVYRTRYGRKGGDIENSRDGFLDEDGIEVPEKAVKGPEAKSHGTALDEEVRTTRGEVWTDVPKYDPEDHPYVVFRFLYRSEESLKALHIIPRTPSPSSSPSRSPSPSRPPSLDDLSAEQRDQVAALLLSFGKSQNGGCKRESSSRRARRIKREHVEEEQGGIDAESVPRKKLRVLEENGKETVDLTAEDSDVDEESLFVN